MNALIQCISAFLACVGFSMIFRIQKNIRFMLAGSLLGTIGWAFYLLSAGWNNLFLQNFIAMLIVAILSELLARFLKAPATIFLLIGCLPLVPGGGIYYTMLYAVQGQNDMFFQSFLSTLGIALSLALAILVSSTLFHIRKTIRRLPAQK